jgi:hypothetical protein
VAAQPFGPTEALLAFTGAIVTSHVEGRIIVHPISRQPPVRLGAPWELCRLDEVAPALCFVQGELVAASGTRLVRIEPSGAILGTIELQAPVTGLVVRAGRVYAAAGLEILQIDPGAGWQIAHRTPLKEVKVVHALDIDRKGRLAVVIQNPFTGRVFELATGDEVGFFAPSQYEKKFVHEADARFSSVSDHLYVAYNRAHDVYRLTTRGGKSGKLRPISAWPTPLATSPDGRWLAARQSGIGVIVWDLADERQVLFAELDEGPAQEKYAKHARVLPAAARELGPGAIKVTRWRSAPQFEGEATAIGVAPGCAYVATGDRDGQVTLIDTATRRIERSDGRVLQEARLSATVQVPECWPWRHVDDQIFFLTPEGGVSFVDLGTAAFTVLGQVDLRDPRPQLHVHGEEVVIIDGQRARAFDRRTFEPRWSFDNPLPMCKELTFDGLTLMGLEDLGGTSRALRHFDPRRGELGGSVPVSLEGTKLRLYDLRLWGHRGRYFLQGTYDPEGTTRYYPIAADGRLGPAAPGNARILEDCEHVLVDHRSGWWLTHVDKPWHAILEAKLDVLSGLAEVDLRNRRVAAPNQQTRRMHVWTLEGAPVLTLDALGWVKEYFFGPGARSLWMLEAGGALRRFDLPPS